MYEVLRTNLQKYKTSKNGQFIIISKKASSTNSLQILYFEI